MSTNDGLNTSGNLDNEGEIESGNYSEADNNYDSSFSDSNRIKNTEKKIFKNDDDYDLNQSEKFNDLNINSPIPKKHKVLQKSPNKRFGRVKI